MKDLPWSERLVQACHAVALLVSLRRIPVDGRLIALAASQTQLSALLSRHQVVQFREPDYGNIVTAVAGTGDPPRLLLL